MTSGSGFNTRAVHSGELKLPNVGNVQTPIFQTSTFMHPNNSEDPLIDNTRGSPYLYTRYGNPTSQAFEDKYASLEGARYAVSFSSGMAAITSTLMAMYRPGTKILSLNELYGQTHTFLSTELNKFGVGVDFLKLDDLNNLHFKADGHCLLYAESVINPTMKVADIVELSKYCKEKGLPLVVDATFASPYNQRPLELGSTVAVHSGTKYISGHSDITIGLAGTSNMEIFHELVNIRKNLGPTVDPIQSFLAIRGLKTLGLRMERENKVAMELAKFLEQHKKVTSVNYPGLTSSPYHRIARKNLMGFGGMLSFEVSGGLTGARKLLSHLKIVSVAASLGGIESLVSLPVDTSHASIPREERLKMGINDGLVRLSCGIEDPEDLIEDLDSALSRV